MTSIKNIVHYSINNIEKENADINLIYGERSNGKSYAVKHEKAVKHYLNTGKRFILMRRFREEINNAMIEQYFQDVDVRGLTDNKFNCIVAYKKSLFFAVYDIESGKTKKYDKIGYIVALSTEQNYAGASYLDVDNIIFEEFMSRSIYLSNEPDRLMNFYCTVDRKREEHVKLWLVGNTISRVCPYIEDWGLHELISSQKQGTILTKEIESTDDDNVKIAIEYCSPTGVSSHTIGKHKEMLNAGSWQSDPQPHLPKSKKEYDKYLSIGFQYIGFKFLGEFLVDRETKDYCWFIYPFKKEFDSDTLIFSDNVRIEPNWQRNIYDITIKNDNIRKILETFREGNIFYSDDLTGTEFKQAIDFAIRR